MLIDYKPQIITIGKDSKIINYLKEIFNYYSYNYNLTIAIKISENIGNYFNTKFKTIYIATSNYCYDITKTTYFIQGCIEKLPNIKEEYLIETLLHELKHAIDWEENNIQMSMERKAVNEDLYCKDINYHDSIPHEKRAIEFAIKEKDKWINRWYKDRGIK